MITPFHPAGDAIDEATTPPLAHDAAARAQWVHDLRNALNLLGVGNKVAQRLIQKGRADDALDALADGMRAWDPCRELLLHAPEATALLALPPPTAAGEAHARRSD